MIYCNTAIFLETSHAMSRKHLQKSSVDNVEFLTRFTWHDPIRTNTNWIESSRDSSSWCGKPRLGWRWFLQVSCSPPARFQLVFGGLVVISFHPQLFKSPVIMVYEIIPIIQLASIIPMINLNNQWDFFIELMLEDFQWFGGLSFCTGTISSIPFTGTCQTSRKKSKSSRGDQTKTVASPRFSYSLLSILHSKTTTHHLSLNNFLSFLTHYSPKNPFR